MGFLQGQKVYQSGSMDSLESKGGAEWRKAIKPRLLEFGLGVIDPTDSPVLNQEPLETEEKRAIVREWKKNGEYEKVREFYKVICHNDLRLIDVADFVICYLDINTFPCGTYDEVYMAAGQRKPVIIVCPYGVNNIPHWLFGRLNYKLFFGSFEEMFTYLERLDAGLEPDLGRWVFFDYDKMYGKLESIK